MNHKLITALLVVTLGYSAFLTYKLFRFEQRISTLETKQPEAVNITPAQPETAPIPGQQSPFDQPNTDPMAPENVAKTGPQTIVNFKSTEHNFGKIKEGEKVRTKFKFTNTGTNPLIITNAMGSCGCTVPQWPKEPIEPGKSGEIEVEFDSKGKSGEIEVEFDSKGKSGEQTKNVRLTANAPTPELIIKSTVIPLDK